MLIVNFVKIVVYHFNNHVQYIKKSVRLQDVETFLINESKTY